MVAEIASGSQARLALIPARVNHVHLIGVAGSAMAALAGMLADRGLRVTGSDNQLYEPTASLLRRLKIEVRPTYDAANLDPAPDLVVVGNVVTRTNPEATNRRHARQDHLDRDDGACPQSCGARPLDAGRRRRA